MVMPEKDLRDPVDVNPKPRRYRRGPTTALSDWTVAIILVVLALFIVAGFVLNMGSPTP
jgi:hypothetical protein